MTNPNQSPAEPLAGSRSYRGGGDAPSGSAPSAPKHGWRWVRLAAVVGFAIGVAWAQDEPAVNARPERPEQLAMPDDARQLMPDEPLWLDATGTRVYVEGRVVLRDGVLEMFACPTGTKEHESIVAVDASAFLIHTALLAVGAEPGSPTQFEPEYRPPNGAEIDVRVEWVEEGEVRSARAQDWVWDVRRDAPMDLPFVFAGSGFWTNPDTGEQHYLAEAGDLICVSNFGTAMLDVPAPSTQANAQLWFEPRTDQIPPLETPVRLVLQPAAEKD